MQICSSCPLTLVKVVLCAFLSMQILSALTSDSVNSFTPDFWATLRQIHNKTWNATLRNAAASPSPIYNRVSDHSDSPPVSNMDQMTTRALNSIVKNEFSRNASTGEYHLEIEFADGNRRYEIGELEMSQNGTEIFVIRGLFTYFNENGILEHILYKVDPEKGYMTFEDPFTEVQFGPEEIEACDPNSRFQSRCIDQKLINILVG